MITFVFKDHIVIVHYTLLSLLGISYSCSIVLASVNLVSFTDETAETFPEKQTSLRPQFCKALKSSLGLLMCLKLGMRSIYNTV